MARLAEDDVKSIGFTRSRRAAELLAEFTRRELDPDLKRRVKSYRAGYLAEDRRELERQLANDELIAVASTNALELGIDIGSLDAAVLVGYPGTRASMWQQAGRAGRRSDGSLAVLVAQDEPLDQYLVTHPADLFDKPPEAAVIDPTNPFVLEPHLACAAREHPLDDDEVEAFWPGAEAALERLVEAGELARRRDRWHHRGREAPHRRVDLRSTGGHTFSIVIRGDRASCSGPSTARARTRRPIPARSTCTRASSSRCASSTSTGRVALVTRSDPDYYTQARDTTDIRVIAADAETTSSGGVPTFYGTVHVTNQVVAFARKLVATGEILDVTPLALPPQTLETKAIWWAIPQEVIDRAAIKPSDLPGAAHAAEHAAIGLLPLVATCDRWDVGGVSTPFHADTASCAIFVYDGYAGRRRHHRARASRAPSDGSRRRSRRSGRARARTAARRACSRRSAATGTSRSTRRARSRCWPRCSARAGDERLGLR